MRRMMARAGTLLCVVAVILVLPACNGAKNAGTASDTSGPDAAAKVPGDSTGGAEAAEIELTVANWEQTQEIVAAHRGKVVVLDLWANW